MRFTKIPLIATLMAVALSLLIVLPAIAQVSGDRTDGRQATGLWLDVRVADNLDDLDNSPGDSTPSPADIGSGDTAYAVAGAFDARDTFFNNTLYVSNRTAAFNTVLISAKVSGAANLATSGPSGVPDDTSDNTGPNGTPLDSDQDQSIASCVTTGGVAVATVKNLRSNTSVTAYLPATASSDDGTTIYQGVAAVWDQDEDVERHNGPCNVDHTDPALHDPDAAADDVDPEDGWTHASAAVIPARDGDSIQITVKGVSGAITVVVDGDAPTIDDVDPSHGGLQNKTTVSLGFTVRDDASGLRYDGEAGGSVDQDLTPHNGDRDQRFDEPLTVLLPGGDNTFGTADDVAGNGSTQDIQVNFTETMDDTYNPCKTGITTCEQTTEADDRLDPTKAWDDTLTAGTVFVFPKMDALWHADAESSRYGTNGWTQVSKGSEYSLDMQLTGKDFDTYYWQITATDRVGNTATTDSDEDEAGDQIYSFKVDNDKPHVGTARTGVRYDAGKGEKADRSWIALSFVNSKNGGADRIDAGTVDASDFTVEGNTVVSALVPSDKKTCVEDKASTTDKDESDKNITAFDAGDKGTAKMCNFEPRARVYLELAQALDSDETPTIQLLGGVLKDIAGNGNVTQSLTNEVEDRIAPGISITVTSTSETDGGRPATDSKGSFKVRVESDEALKTFPKLYFGSIAGMGTATGTKFGAATKLTAADVSTAVNLSEKEDNVWEKTVKASTLPGGATHRLVALIVTATDESNNSGNSKGWTIKGSGPADGDSLKFKDLDSGGFLVEVDSKLDVASIEVLPSTDPGSVTDKTESMNPYIQITFSEGNEYGIAATDGKGTDATTDDVTGTAYKADIGDGKSSNTDSHADVQITSLTLNGEDRLDEVVRVKAGEYVLAVTGLEVGDYEIVYTAQDDVGNKAEANNVNEIKFSFEVQERQPYKVGLQPGWNLVSVPGDPFNPAVGEVIGGGLKADTVLGYQGGEWVTAVRNEDGRWQGTLGQIVGGYGYWVRTTAVESISTVIPPIAPTTTLPTVPVVSGWNLLGVIDAEQRKAGTTEDADQYLTSLSAWRVAYGFNTQVNQWTKLLPGTTDTVANGKGYWVWSTTPGTLVP